MSTPTPVPTGEITGVYLSIEPWMLWLIIIATIGSLMGALWLVYHFVNNIRYNEIQRAMLKETVKNQRFMELKKQTPFFDKQIQSSKAVEEERDRYTQDMDNDKEELVELEKSRSKAIYIVKRKAKLRDNIKWYQDELEKNKYKPESIEALKEKERKYTDEKITIENQLWEKAEQDAEKLVPKSLTIAGMGITGTFFVELTAIVTIIFGVIILGLVGVLGTQEIAPILAAIAGYVLGKASSSTQTTQPQNPNQ